MDHKKRNAEEEVRRAWEERNRREHRNERYAMIACWILLPILVALFILTSW